MHVKTVYWGHLLVFQMSIRWRRLLGFNYDYFSPFPIILFTRSQIYCYELCWILNFYTNRICLDITEMHPNSYLGCFSLNQMFEGESALGTRLRCIINCQFKNFGRHWFDSRKYVCVRRLTVASLHQSSDLRVLKLRSSFSQVFTVLCYSVLPYRRTLSPVLTSLSFLFPSCSFPFITFLSSVELQTASESIFLRVIRKEFF